MDAIVNGIPGKLTERPDGSWRVDLEDGRIALFGAEVGQVWSERDWYDRPGTGGQLDLATYTDGPAALHGPGRPTPRSAARIVRVTALDDRCTITLARDAGPVMTLRVLAPRVADEVPESTDLSASSIAEIKARIGRSASAPGREIWLANLRGAVDKARAQLEAAEARLAAAEGR